MIDRAASSISDADNAAAVATARAAGLHYMHDARPGLRRRRLNKVARSGTGDPARFAIEDANGKAVKDEATLARVRKLAIPPAWENVWICPDPAGHLQATGRDARGRKQYRYHPRWREERDSTKYSRMIDFGRALPGLRRRISADLRLTGLPRRKVLATVVRLLETTFIRVGNEEYARTNKSFGLTTLKGRHVDLTASEVRFHFRGKSGVYHQISVHDPSIARTVRRCRDLPGQELFQYVDEAGAVAAIDSADVNEYIRELAGRDFTAKDFRTWAGTVLAAMALQALGANADAMTSSASRGRNGSRNRNRKNGGLANGTATARPNNKNVVRAIAQVAEQLGNTPSVCRKCYVHPDVIASYLDGTLATALSHSRPVPAARASRARSHTLRPDEAAVLALLRHNARPRAKEARLADQLKRSLRQVKGHRVLKRGTTPTLPTTRREENRRHTRKTRRPPGGSARNSVS